MAKTQDKTGAGDRADAPAGGNRRRRGSGGRVTSYDVARHAGVSQSAVSRCFQPGASVSQKTRDRVVQAAKELGYYPNAMARGLITQRSNLVAVIISELTNLYYPEVLFELSHRFSDRGIRLLLFTIENESAVDDILAQVWQYRVDGVISAARLTPEQIADFEKQKVPLVFYNRAIADTPVNAVYCDNPEGVRTLVDGLYAAGARRFGLISGPADSWIAKERLESACAALTGLGAPEPCIVSGNFSYQCGYQGLEELIDRMGVPPDAVIAANDTTAIGCIDAARETYGLRVPHDLSVVGFDGIGPGRWSSYRLTTIRQPVRRMTEATVAMVMERIEKPDLPPEKRTFSGIKLEGQSARLGARDDEPS